MSEPISNPVKPDKRLNKTARGLFRATGNISKPVIVDLIDGEAVYAEHLEREKDDFYPTPIEPIRALLAYEGNRIDSLHSVWEPAAGDGVLIGELEDFGLKVHASDLVDRGCGAQIKDFYEFTPKSKPFSSAIITNPPFDQCQSSADAKWQRHAFGLGISYMALLLPLNFAGAATLAGFWNDHAPARVYLMRWRIDFTGQGAPPMLNAWYVWDGQTDPSDTRFLMMDRKDWRQGNLFGDGQ